ncbi:hypothetical protein B9Q03_14305 [Candidatus Marsarchaeota G2 archaeon OSP_D]|uniref:Uncharacterized protein n=1 Tax=Candidatus Marsarchaeota G2 archaeon OSP_D TaxID=1978157 RepID=A0A2R6A7J6_9ARCH|nr:MAG: hypothetical protein B9Q03_14305 [Candidatus Marsarchaeota G2 archaeon OSP_D]
MGKCTFSGVITGSPSADEDTSEGRGKYLFERSRYTYSAGLTVNLSFSPSSFMSVCLALTKSLLAVGLLFLSPLT